MSILLKLLGGFDAAVLVVMVLDSADLTDSLIGERPIPVMLIGVVVGLIGMLVAEAIVDNEYGG